ncbi:MAG: trypsin-like peptidase domain-containing protein [Planctomycetota bacterium]
MMTDRPRSVIKEDPMLSLPTALAVIVWSGAGQTVLLDFYSDQCPPCRSMEPTIQALEAKGYPVRRVNVDRETVLAQQYQVTNIPCYVMLADGQVVDRVVGGTTFFRLEGMFQLAQQRAGVSGAGIAGGLSATPPSPGAPLTAPPRSDAPTPNGFGGTSVPLSGTTPPSNSVTPASFLNPIAGDFPVSAGVAPLGGQPPAANSVAGSQPLQPNDPLLAVSVRLRIEDRDGHSCGSGTIIDAREGEALILTCGHVFRDSQGKGRIQVEVFTPEGVQTLEGALVTFDLDRDVGLVSVRSPRPLRAARVAPAGFRVGEGEPVVSVGCNHGAAPTLQHSRITAVDRIVGPPNSGNYKVTGQPVEGRSGGGLFMEDGTVIGVCNAADPQDRDGLYASISSIHWLLDQVNLGFVYRQDSPNAVPLGPVPGTVAGGPPASVMPAPGGGFALPGTLPGPEGPVVPPNAGMLSAEEQAAVDEIVRRLRDGAEVICVVRSRTDPSASSEVIMLEKASPEFLRQLIAEARPGETRHETSLEIPRLRPAAFTTPVGSGGLPPSADTPALPQRNASGELRLEWSATPSAWRTSR